jgi:hypothetical protein
LEYGIAEASSSIGWPRTVAPLHSIGEHYVANAESQHVAMSFAGSSGSLQAKNAVFDEC